MSKDWTGDWARELEQVLKGWLPDGFNGRAVNLPGKRGQGERGQGEDKRSPFGDRVKQLQDWLERDELTAFRPEDQAAVRELHAWNRESQRGLPCYSSPNTRVWLSPGEERKRRPPIIWAGTEWAAFWNTHMEPRAAASNAEGAAVPPPGGELHVEAYPDEEPISLGAAPTAPLARANALPFAAPPAAPTPPLPLLDDLSVANFNANISDADLDQMLEDLSAAPAAPLAASAAPTASSSSWPLDEIEVSDTPCVLNLPSRA